MFGIDSAELLVVAVLALLFIGPNELPKVMIAVGRLVGRMRGYARHFTAGIENAMREAELEEMEKAWAEQNQRVLAQYPADADYPEGGAVIPPPPAPPEPVDAAWEAEPGLPFEAPAAPDDDPLPPVMRPLP